MEKTKIDIICYHADRINMHYPYWPSSFGKCSTDGCKNYARGCGYCADCHENKLSEIVGSDLAKKYHVAVKTKIDIYRTMCDIANSEDESLVEK